VIVPAEKNFCANVGNTGVRISSVFYWRNFRLMLLLSQNDLLTSLAGEGLMTLRRRIDIANAQEDLVNNLGRIEKATGVKYDFEVDWVAILPVMSEDHGNQVGSIVYKNYLKELASNIERLCKDELGKEAFVEKTQEKKLIRFVLDTKEKPNGGYSDCAFDPSGVLILHVSKNRFVRRIVL